MTISKRVSDIANKALGALRRKPVGYRPILSVEADPKTSKSIAKGFLTGILYLAPANTSGRQVCYGASPWCIELCLNLSGHGKFDSIQAIRIEKTNLLFEHRELFLACLRYDLAALARRAAKRGLKPAARINGTSDLPWLAKLMAREFPQIAFYDYTKLPKPELRQLPNYRITFSYSGENLAESLRVLKLGINVAVVFTTHKGFDLPESWYGYRVIDGDAHDLRFLDAQGVVVGLRAKGLAIDAESPFVVIAGA